MISKHFWILHTNNQWIHPKIKNNNIYIEEYELFKFDKYIKNSNEIINNKSVKRFHNTNYYFICDVSTISIYDATLNSNGYIKLIVKPYISSIEIHCIIKYLSEIDSNLPISLIKEMSKNYRLNLNYSFFNNRNNIYNKIFLMIKFLDKIVRCFYSLCSNEMNYSLQKYYKKYSIPRHIDQTSIRLNLLNFHRKKYAPSFYLSYDTPANRFIKQIARRIIYFINNKGIKNIRLILDNIKNYYSYDIQHNKNNSDYVRDRNKCSNYIRSLKESSNQLNHINRRFLGNVLDENISIPPKNILLSFRYNIIYRYYLKIKKIEFYFDSNYIIKRFRKRNNYLYEVWTYFVLIHVLKKAGYKLTNHPEHLTQYYLNYGLDLIFRKSLNDNEYIQLDVIYNIRLTVNNRKMPLMIIGKHCNPDIVLNISINNNTKEYYLGTIILDAKCMYREAIPHIHNNEYQFLNYINKAHLSSRGRSEIGQKQGYVISYDDYNPVNAVFALYPISSKYPNKFDSKITKLKKYLIYQRLNPLKNSDFKQFKSRLLKGIKYCLIVNSNLSLKNILKI